MINGTLFSKKPFSKSLKIVLLISMLVIFGIAGCSDGNNDSSTTPAGNSSPVGNWLITTPSDSRISVKFMEGGILSTKATGVVEVYGDWSQNDRSISFDINKFSSWDGTISSDGKTMSGSMSNSDGLTGEWTAVRYSE